MCQPPNSPDLNVLDLGLFCCNSIHTNEELIEEDRRTCECSCESIWRISDGSVQSCLSHSTILHERNYTREGKPTLRHATYEEANAREEVWATKKSKMWFSYYRRSQGVLELVFYNFNLTFWLATCSLLDQDVLWTKSNCCLVSDGIAKNIICLRTLISSRKLGHACILPSESWATTSSSCFFIVQLLYGAACTCLHLNMHACQPSKFNRNDVNLAAVAFIHVVNGAHGRKCSGVISLGQKGQETS